MASASFVSARSRSALLLTLLSCLAAATATATATTRILPLGDSLTAGCGSLAGPANNWTSVWLSGSPPYSQLSGGFRAPLWSSLTAAGFSVEMVGSQRNGPSYLPAAAQAHEGWPGISIRGMTKKAPWVGLGADIVLLMLGTNDLYENRTLAQLTGDMGALLASLRTALPRATLIVQTLMRISVAGRPELEPAVAAYNAALVGVTAAAGAGVLLLDTGGASGLCNADTSPLRRLCTECNEAWGGKPAPCVADPAAYARVHPTAAGYGVLAGIQAAFISALLEGGAGGAAPREA